MSEPTFNFQDDDGVWKPLTEVKLLDFLRSPKGQECLADAVRAARGLVPHHVDPLEFEALSKAENDLRAASARPLPPELAL